MSVQDFKQKLEQLKYELTEKPKEMLTTQAKNKLLGLEDNSGNTKTVLPEFEQELSFASNGVIKGISRYHQALKYQGYGMECNACCVIYFLQSYGLLPANIPRKIFEYLFTVLNPPNELSEKNISQNKKEPILFDGSYIKPLEDDIFKGLFKNSANFLQGKDGAIIPNYGNSATSLFEIMKRFYMLSFTKEYKFLQSYHNSSLNSLFYDDAGVNPIVSRYKDLADGTLSDNYFKQGNTIFVALDYLVDGKYSSYQHYCIIAAPKMATLNIDNIDYHFYPADDPLTGATFVASPHTSRTNTIKTLFREKVMNGEITLLNVISPAAAIGI